MDVIWVPYGLSRCHTGYPSILLLVWQRLRTLGTFSRNATHLCLEKWMSAQFIEGRYYKCVMLGLADCLLKYSLQFVKLFLESLYALKYQAWILIFYELKQKEKGKVGKKGQKEGTWKIMFMKKIDRAIFPSHTNDYNKTSIWKWAVIKVPTYKMDK